jgi:hypothetical protein
MVEAVLEHGELLAVFCRAFRTAFFTVGVQITPFVVPIPIVIKM